MISSSPPTERLQTLHPQTFALSAFSDSQSSAPVLHIFFRNFPENQKKLVKQMFEGGVSATVQLEDWKKSLEIKELDRTLLALTVDKIYIYENKQIKIHIRYQDMIEKMKVIRRFYAEHRTERRKEVG